MLLVHYFLPHHYQIKEDPDPCRRSKAETGSDTLIGRNHIAKIAFWQICLKFSYKYCIDCFILLEPFLGNHIFSTNVKECLCSIQCSTGRQPYTGKTTIYCSYLNYIVAHSSMEMNISKQSEKRINCYSCLRMEKRTLNSFSKYREITYIFSLIFHCWCKSKRSFIKGP